MKTALEPTFAKLGIVAVLSVLPSVAKAADFYVAPSGNDDNAGTEAAPFATMQRGQEAASPGDTVYFRGGDYVFSGDSAVGVLLNKDGEPDLRINYFAYPGEKPVFDFFGLNPQARITGFQVRADWIHIKGLELRGVQQILTDVNESWCVHVEGSSNIFELLDLHHNEGPGLFINQGGDNLVLNVDSHHNYDPDRGGENSDGFGCHSDNAGNVFRGCRAWFNSDDGYDFISSPGVCTVEYSWAFRNGFVPDTTEGVGNGAGFKAGGFGAPANPPPVVPRHVVRFNVSFANLSSGFYANHHPGGLDFINNTAFDNSRNFDLWADQGPADHFLRNNLAVEPGDPIARETVAEIDQTINSWSLGVTVDDGDFLSMSDSGVDGPRQADGSLPALDFLKLQTLSDLIDAGQDQGFPFNDAAPDLGAYESGAPLGSGGAGGAAAGGSAGSAGVGTGGAPGSGGLPAAGASGSAGATPGGAAGAGPNSFPPGRNGGSDVASGACGCRSAGRTSDPFLALVAALFLAAIMRWRRS